MGFWDFFKFKIKKQKRGFAAAKSTHLTSSWTKQSLPLDHELKSSLAALRARSRELCMNNDYAKRFVHLLKLNVVGPQGIKLQMKATDKNGNADRERSKLIEEQFEEWGELGICDVTTKFSWIELQKVAISSIGRDGEVLVRLVNSSRNKFGFSLQLLEGDSLDETYSRNLESNKEIRLGVEVDEWGAPSAYHLKTTLITNESYNYLGKRYLRVPAEEILHIYMIERASQTRGIPWMHAAMNRLNMLGGYEESELVAARVASSKMGFFTSDAGTGYTGQDQDGDGNVYMEAEPGTFEQLPRGVDFKSWDPQHDTSNFEAFIKAILRGISAGLCVAYNSLTTDLKDVNYSSIRSGVLEERDTWTMIQNWLAESFCQRIYRQWLRHSILHGVIKIPFTEMQRYTKPHWQGRRWAWVDPENDTKANLHALKAGLKSRQQIAAESGRDLEDVFREIQSEEILAKQMGIILHSEVQP
jgi:lambda family phage portal protein